MLNIKGKSHLWARCDKHGWLWKRTGHQGAWTRCWVLVKGSLLLVFPDEKVVAPVPEDAFPFSRLNTLQAAALASGSLLKLAYLRQEQEPLDAFRLHSDTCLCEKSLNESETRNKRYCKAMTLKLPRSDIESNLEETQELLLFQQPDLEEERSSRFLRVWFAAENEKQHLSWQSESA